MCPSPRAHCRTPRPRVLLALLFAALPLASASAQSPEPPIAAGDIVTELETDDPSLSARRDTGTHGLAPLASLRVRPQNLGAAVNSPATELGPVIAPDGRTIYFTRGGARGNQDIWFSRVDDSTGEWAAAVRMPQPLTNPYNNFVESVTPDGITLLVGGRYLGRNTIITGLALSHRTRDGWSTPEPLRIRNYYSRSRSVSSCLGSDGGTIVMSLERDGGRGRQDLYVSFREQSGEWSEPHSLGAAVNSAEIDFAPFLAADGVTLYFASKGHGGYGDADIFVTRRLDDTWQNWTTPTNLGPAINSEQWDAYYVIPASGEFVYFVSVSDAIGESDLVRVPLPAEVRPRPVALVSGRVVNSVTGEPLEATIRYETLPGGVEVGTARTDPRTGAYAIALPSGASYAFRAEASGYLGVGDNLDLKSLEAYLERSNDLAMVPFEQGRAIALRNLFFDFGAATLREESFPELERLAKLMLDNPTLEIEVAGHTDGIGSDAANEKLSDARVESVVTYLVARGVEYERLHTAYYGESRPVAPNVSDEGRRRNRRVEFTILKR